ncbi:MAG: Cell cycle checkpoint protein rad17 [Alectoria sarmentosa]|nr:MAG: Cell cycle checkpoint protein rad17 [Alectoria sarmentosa]CAD6593655.1 MAG: Cell cycle checkpoint protein rad17 [Alectoria sarmentosa]
MAPPAKRQKRLIVLSSDDEKPDAKTAPKLVLPRSQAELSKSSTGRSGIVSQPIPDTLPNDHAAKLKFTSKAQTSRPISSFFSAGTQAQQPNGHKNPEAVAPDVEDQEDLIVDDFAVENVNEIGGTTISTALDHRKKHLELAYDNAAAPDRSSLQGGKQRFKIPEHAPNMGISPGIPVSVKAKSSNIDLRPWAEKYGPNNLEELMVHKKKVSDVRNWLENVLWGQDRKVCSSRPFVVVPSLIVSKRLLLLKGPSGAGKTATISMLAKAMGVDVLEWKNPVGSEFPSEAYLSMSAHFEDFLGRSGKYNQLALAGIHRNLSATPSSSIDVLSENTRKRIILMEEFPNTFINTSSALRSFRSSVLQYLVYTTPSTGAVLSKKQGDNPNVTPVVMVITETRLTTSTAASDSFTAHRLLGPELLSHAGVSTLEFNPIASTYLTKALDFVVQKEARQSGRRRVPGPAVLKKLGEVGDIRSAIGSLEFLCLRREVGNDWGGRVALRAKKGANASSALTKMERESLEMVSQRESTLGLFHAVGKVVYNKRDDFAGGDAAREPPPQPPSHLSGHVRLRVPQVSVDQLIGETGTDIATFIAALHENFVLSCEGNSFTDSFDGCIDALSDSDILNSPRGGRFGSSGDHGNHTFQGAASDTLRQDEMCFQVAVRGLLFALPDPVKRRTHPISEKNGGRSDTYRMLYPTSMRLSGQVEEIDGLVGQWTDRLRASAVPLGIPACSYGRHFTHLPSRPEMHPSNLNADHLSQPDQDGPAPFRTGLGCTKGELIVERLPYITKIEQRNAASTHLKELERITQFQGTTPPGNEASEDEDVREAAPFSDWTTDVPAEGNVTGPVPSASLQQGLRQAGKAASTLALPFEEEVGQLYLSDDDIEDD